jgi:ATP-binding cassette subfamily A (ABC1) protein 3
MFVVFMLSGLASILLAYVVSLFASTQLCAYGFVAAGQVVMFLTYLIGYLCTPRTR